ncbi:hypothetical protein EII29_07330 [Leptotrichia sp. OH3620_COT-345]|uniref:hypothetical protein n=1 Tax=Leptotrichia sp. OH3620_COT-345 TaxID=2491048 RepID=UPI000F64B210|nr:hypothetical protein [Leptotrichia sp. OH3620_COT-345]RRD39391.1 hypothetical protein EII29_07330 [Leptotrichia sp. OH3620_COT-345]
MKKIKIGKIICLIFGLMLVVNPGISAKSSMEKKIAKKTSISEKKSEAERIAEKFMNDYIKENISLEDWLAASPVTENFRKMYKERSRALELAEKQLENKKLSESERKLLNKYKGIEYNTLLGSEIFATSSEHSNFKVKSWNEKTGTMILKDNIKPEFAVHSEGKPINVEVKLKLVKSNGKWLIDGAGAVNIKK